MAKSVFVCGAALVLVLSFALSACGSDSQISSGPDHNQADESFAIGMIQHHQGALDMARMSPERTQNPAVLDLSRRIVAAQQPEIDQMSAWLDQWKVDRGSGDDMTHMTGDVMAQLMNARGALYDRLFLEEMVRHHRDAVTMSEVELRDGQSQPAKELARRIIDTQNAEIQEMQRLLASSSGR